MKTRNFFAVVAVTGVSITGCATNTTTSSQTQADETKKRVHTAEELRKSGQSETGPALEQTDPAVRMSGPH